MRRPLVLLLALALSAGACGKGPDDRPRPTLLATASPPPDPPSLKTPTARADAPAQTSGTAGGSGATARVQSLADRPPPTFGRKPRAPVDDGAPTARLVFERAQRAFADKDNATVFHCVAPATRKAWLGSMVFAGEFASMGRSSVSGPRRAALEELRAILDRYGASLSVEERLAGLTIEELKDALLRKVEDPAGLFAELLAWSARQGEPTDPLRALAEPKVLVAPLEPTNGPPQQGPPGSTGMAGVLDRLAGGATLGELRAESDSASVTLKRGGAAERREVQRFVRQGGAWFLEE